MFMIVRQLFLYGYICFLCIEQQTFILLIYISYFLVLFERIVQNMEQLLHLRMDLVPVQGQIGNFLSFSRSLGDLSLSPNSTRKAKGWDTCKRDSDIQVRSRLRVINEDNKGESTVVYLDIRIDIQTHLSEPFPKITSIGNMSIIIIKTQNSSLMIIY